MTKLTFALGLLARLRMEKDPPLTRYCCLLSLAENPEKELTAPEIFRRFGLKEAIAGSLDCAVRNGLVIEIQARPQKLYRISPAGLQIVASILSAKLTPATITRKRRPVKGASGS